MLTDDWDKVTHIICDGKKFKVIKAIFETQSLVGCTTRVWEIEFEGRRLILKDSWIESSHPMAEYELLQHLQGVEGVSQFYCGEDVCIDGKKLSTDIIRQGKWGIRTKVQVQRRIVSSSIGDHIASFRSKRELISALHDITIVLKELYQKNDLIHWDISYNNILLFHSEDNPGDLHPGLLINFEYAITLSKSHLLAPSSHTVCILLHAISNSCLSIL
ncbi:hypothetical protein L208DRAFT_1305228 [Tricholoma matsutake]|nr:hypothetical protein L208DRAFT_1305228 [Tricholoma matsutake 945]